MAALKRVRFHYALVSDTGSMELTREQARTFLWFLTGWTHTVRGIVWLELVHGLAIEVEITRHG